MEQSQVESIIREAFPEAVVVSVEKMKETPEAPRLAWETDLFSGVLVDESFEGKDQIERFRAFQKAIQPSLTGSPKPEVRLRLMAKSEYERLVSRVA